MGDLEPRSRRPECEIGLSPALGLFIGHSGLVGALGRQTIRPTRSLALALRLLTLIETQIRRGLAQARERAAGLSERQPSQTTDRPTVVWLLKGLARAEINRDATRAFLRNFS